MALYQLVITDKNKANQISSKARSFDFSSEDTNIKLGDLIHYNYMENDRCIKHPVGDYVYVVTCIEKLPVVSVFSIREAMPWSGYVPDKLGRAYTEKLRCNIQLYSCTMLHNCTITSYDGGTFIITDEYGGKFRKEIDDIANIAILNKEVMDEGVQ